MPGMPTRRQLRVPVAAVAPPGVNEVAVEIVEPTGSDRPVVWWMLAGGSMMRRYWDLRVADGAYSCAQFLAGHGYRCVLVDHPGTGDSEAPDDAYQLTPTMLAAINAHVHAQVVDQLGGPPTIGCGHSMGGMITVITQATARPHRALCLLGSSGRGLPDQLDDDELACADRPDQLAAAIAAIVERRFGSPRPTRPFVAAEVLAEAQAPLLAVAGLSAMIPGSFDPQIAAVDVPVMLARGEHDMAPPLATTAAAFTAAPAIHTVEIPAMGHNHNASSRRVEMWQAMLDWAEQLFGAGRAAG